MLKYYVRADWIIPASFFVAGNKKDSQFLGSLKLQLVAAHGFEPRTLRV